MAITTKLLTLRSAFISAAVLSTALMLKLSIPVFIEFLNSEIPYLWSIVIIWLKPPYLYVVMNCIIITIVASTKLQPQKIDVDGFVAPPVPIQIKVAEPVSDPIGADPVVSSLRFEYANDVPEKELVSVTETETETENEEYVIFAEPVSDPICADPVVSSLMFEYVNDVPEKEVEGVAETETETENEEYVISRSNWMPQRKRNPDVKPLVSQRFSTRRSAKANPEGGKVQLGVTKPKRQDTLESTWRMITEGRPMPLTRHLKKSDTWDTQGREVDDSPATPVARSMKKAETFNDHATSPGSGGGSGRIKREPSLSQDELNRRVEAFIRKFNEEMRLQHLESLQQYNDAVGRETKKVICELQSRLL